MPLKYCVLILLIIPCIHMSAYAQCSIAPQTSISGNRCVGSQLRINSNVLPESVTWELNGSVVSAQTVAASQNAVTVAGGNGAGNGANQLNYPDRLYVDPAGVLYIPDLQNNRVQKWLPGATSGVTVAGGNGTGAAANQFNRPTSVFVDLQGNVYVADQSNGRVQKWAPGASSGVTVASGLTDATDVFVDKKGNLYVSDQWSGVVMKYAPGSSIGVVVAGDHTSNASPTGLNSPTGIFVDDAGTLYICDTDNDRVQKWAAGATSGTTVVGGYNNLANPLDVSVDCSGNVYVSDYGNHRIRKYAAGSTYTPGALVGTTVAGGNGPGTGANQLNNPVGVFIVGNNSLYVTDFSNHRVQRFSNSINPLFTPAVAGTYSITVNYPCCPTYNESFDVYDPQTPLVSISTPLTDVCPGDVVTFSAQNANQIQGPVYQWKINGADAGSNSDTYISSALHNGDQLQCILTSTKACTLPLSATSNTIFMAVFIPTPVNLGKDFSICPGSDTLLKVPAIYRSYTWQDNSTQGQMPVSGAGKYYVTVKDLCNEEFSDTISVSIFHTAANFLPADMVVCSYDMPVLTSKVTFSSYRWNDQSTGASLAVAQPGLYWLQARDENNCTVTDSVFIQTKTCPPQGAYIPNAFSPNSNGVNDIFKPLMYGKVKSYRFTVYTRYGQVIFDSSDPARGWDGMINGNYANSGVYVWLCKYELVGLAPKTEKGTVVLIK